MKNKFIALFCALMLCLSMTVPGYASEGGATGQRNVVAVGPIGIAVVKADGSLWVWGGGAYGIASMPTKSAPKSPTKVTSEVDSVYAWTEGWESRSDVPPAGFAILKQDSSLWI